MIKEIIDRLLFAAICVLLAFGAVITFIVLAGTAQGATPPPVLTISVAIDKTLANKLGEEAARDYLRSVMAGAAETYRTQVGLELRVSVTDINHIADHTNPSALLAEVQRARTLDTLWYESGATIFFTERDLRIGVHGYYGYASSGPVYSSLSAAVIHITYSPAIDASTTAHELAHLFAVPHDGEKYCAEEPPTGYIMQSIGTGGPLFSPCSLKILNAVIQDTPALRQVQPPPPVQNSGGGSFDDALLGFLLGVAFLAYSQRRR